MLTKEQGFALGYSVLSAGVGFVAPPVVVPPVDPPVEPPSGLSSVDGFIAADDSVGAVLFDFSEAA